MAVDHVVGHMWQATTPLGVVTVIRHSADLVFVHIKTEDGDDVVAELEKVKQMKVAT